MADTILQEKSFKELNELYQRLKVELKHETNIEGTKFYFEPIIRYATDIFSAMLIVEEELNFKILTIRASLYYDQARIFLAKQNIPGALEILKLALNLVEDHKINPKITYLYFRILNQLAYFLAKIENLEESLALLESAEILYKSLEDTSNIMIFDTEDLFQDMNSMKKRTSMKFEKLISNNFHLQGWIYNRQNLTDKFIIYHHMVLKRQLETQDGNALSWVFKCARLGSYFFGMHKFSEARHHLAAACHVLREYELDLLKHRSEPHFVAEWSNLQKYYADMGKYWVKYGLFLFEASRRYLALNSSNDNSINDMLIKSFKDTAPREDFQAMPKTSKDKLDTIHEKPESPSEFSKIQELPRNNESLECVTENFRPFNIKFKKSTHSNKEEIKKVEEEYIDENKSENQKSDLDIKKNYEGEEITVDENKEDDKIEEKDIEEIEKIQEEENKNNEKVFNKDVAEITKNIIDALDDHMTLVETDENENSAPEKYIQILEEAVFLKKNLPLSDDKITDNSNSKIINSTDILENSSEIIINECTINADKLQSKLEDNINVYKFTFPTLTLQEIESKVTHELISNIESARTLFLFAQEWLKRSKGYYSIQDYPLDYINLILDLNELYRYLSLYETNVDTQYDLQKRRVELLEKLSTILKEYRPQYYISLNIELLNELTQAQIELIALNLRRLNSVQPQQSNVKVPDFFQQKEEALRKMEALIEIRKRLTRKDSEGILVG